MKYVFFSLPFLLLLTPFSIAIAIETNLDKLPNEFVKMPENPFRLNQKPCKNLSVDEYLLTKANSHQIVNVDHLKSNASFKWTSSSANSSNHSNNVPISIDVKHDLFDTNYGLVRNVIYAGM